MDVSGSAFERVEKEAALNVCARPNGFTAKKVCDAGKAGRRGKSRKDMLERMNVRCAREKMQKRRAKKRLLSI